MNNNDNNEWKQVGGNRRLRNQRRRQEKKKNKKLQERIFKKDEEKRKGIENNKFEWRKRRIELIKMKEYENFKTRKINPNFAKAIKKEREEKNMTIEDLALKLMIPDHDLKDYERCKKCPESHTVVKLRKLFDDLPRKYFIFSD